MRVTKKARFYSSSVFPSGRRALIVLQLGATWCPPECFEGSWEKWKTMTLVARRNFQCSGVIVLECLIDSVTFANRCAAKQQENNSTARGEYASEVLGAAHSEPVPHST